MTRKKLRDDNKRVSVTNLLDEFAEPDPVKENPSHKVDSDTEYIEMMVKKEIERKLIRSRRDNPPPEIADSEIEIDDAIPKIPEGSCPSCYYCTIIRRIGQSVYCVCANPERTIDGMYFDHRMWVRSEPDLSCHKEPPMKSVQKLLRQRIEQLQLSPNRNVTMDAVFETKENIHHESEVLNFFDGSLELVEEEPMIEDPDIPEGIARPPPFVRKEYSEPDLLETDVFKQEIQLAPLERNEDVDSYFREETIAVHKHKALQTLEKYRKDRQVDLRRPKESPIISEKISLVKKCENCYFCVNTKRVGGSAWCHCTHIGRSLDTTSVASWVRSRLNSSCWRRLESL
ncbi:MAG: hypothetical protein ACW98U_09650 [Candidatus Thorarchaeota archaeon]